MATDGLIGMNSNVADTQQYEFLMEPTRKFFGQVEVRNFQGITLMVGDEKLGVLFVNYSHPHSFGEEQRETARTFANHAALALKNAKLLDQISKAKKVAEVVTQVMALGDREATLRSVARELGRQSAAMR